MEKQVGREVIRVWMSRRKLSLAYRRDNGPAKHGTDQDEESVRFIAFFPCFED
jgi:hypothetical protein